MSLHLIILVAHLVGLALGMGGASTFDAIFLVASRRGRVTPDLIAVVHAAAGLVAGAMALLAVSGVAFLATGVEPTPKFWAKMVIVAVACLNGLAAHRLVFPLLESAAAAGTGQLLLRPWAARLAATSAAVSGVSWFGALVLGAWRGLTLGMVPILAGYASVLVAAILVSTILIAPRIFVFTPNDAQRRVRSWRDLPAAAVYGLALAIADATLAIAARARSGGSVVDGAGVGRFAIIGDDVQPEWRIASPPIHWPCDDGNVPGRRLSAAPGDFDDDFFPPLPDWPNHRIDSDSGVGHRS